MATPLAMGQYLEAKFFTADAQQQGINVLHYYVQGIAGGAMTDQQLCDSMSPTMGNLYKNYMPTVCTYLGQRLQVIFPAPMPVAVTSTIGTGVGAQASDPLPSAATLLISKRSGLAGRHGRGRMYLPFWPESASGVTGAPSPGAITQATNVAAQALATWVVIVGGVTVTLLPVIWNRTTSTAITITNNLIRTQWATQRRRAMVNRGDVFGP